MFQPSTRTLQQRLADGVVLGAAGYVFELERRGYVKAGPFVPEVVLDHPEAVRELLYTAVTRARENLILVGTEAAIRMAVERPVARASGLRRRLWPTG